MGSKLNRKGYLLKYKYFQQSIEVEVLKKGGHHAHGLGKCKDHGQGDGHGLEQDPD